MTWSKFIESHIIKAAKKNEADHSVEEKSREPCVNKATFYNGRKKQAGAERKVKVFKMFISMTLNSLDFLILLFIPAF